MKHSISIPSKVRQKWGSRRLSTLYDRTEMIEQWRYAACALLAFARIPNALWFEDVLVFYGYKTRLSELCLVVDDPILAANVLVDAGYYRARHVKSSSFRAGCLGPEDAFLSCPTDSTDVILLKASDWCYDLRVEELHDYKCPWLPRYLNALMTYWLSVPPEEYDDKRITMEYVAELVATCYSLNDLGRRVASNRYAKFLLPYHHELHYDIVARCKNIIRLEFEHKERHQYHFQRCQQIKDGTFSPRPYKRGRFYPQLQPLYE